MANPASGAAALAPDFYHAPTRHKGIFAWILSTDHKRIGLLYFGSMMVFFTIAVILGLLMRLELLTPGQTIVEAQTYNTLFTLHGIMMIFLFIIPGLTAVLGQYNK